MKRDERGVARARVDGCKQLRQLVGGEAADIFGKLRIEFVLYPRQVLARMPDPRCCSREALLSRQIEEKYRFRPFETAFQVRA